MHRNFYTHTHTQMNAHTHECTHEYKTRFSSPSVRWGGCVLSSSSSGLAVIVISLSHLSVSRWLVKIPLPLLTYQVIQVLPGMVGNVCDTRFVIWNEWVRKHWSNTYVLHLTNKYIHMCVCFIECALTNKYELVQTCHGLDYYTSFVKSDLLRYVDIFSPKVGVSKIDFWPFFGL